MADKKTLINEALRSIKILEAYPRTAKETVDRLQKYFRDRGIELTVVNKDIDDSQKDLADYERQLAAADKTLAALVKAKADADTAKKLDAAIKTAGPALKALRNNLTTYDKFADKAEKDDTTIDKIAAELLKLGAPTLKSLTAANITLPSQPMAVRDALDKRFPPEVVVKTFTLVGADLRAVKEVITKGEIFSKSADTLLSRRKDAFEPSTIAACGKVDTLKTTLEAALAELQSSYGKAMDDMREFGTRMKSLLPAARGNQALQN